MMLSEYDLQVIIAAATTGALLSCWLYDQLTRREQRRTPRAVVAAAALALLLLAAAALHPVYIERDTAADRLRNVDPVLLHQMSGTLERIAADYQEREKTNGL